ncbi:MAG: preprotein translocase subunit SecA [Phycisphaerales bacterium]
MGVPIVGNMMKKMFGTRNDRMVKRYMRVVDQVNEYEPEIRKLSDPEIRSRSEVYRKRMAAGERAYDMIPEVFAVAREAMDRAVGIRNIFNPAHADAFDASTLPASAKAAYDAVQKEIASLEPREPEGDLLGNTRPIEPWEFVEIPVALYDAVRELYPESRPPFRARPFDVQIIGGVVLYEGRIAEMKTGEGKTIVAPLATYLAVLEGKQVHVVTVNDYLVQRDRDWTFPFFRALGLTVGAIHPMHMQPPPMKQEAYQCDVVYGTTSEFGFDFLRDNMKMSTQEQVQKGRHFAVVDEVDSTLIDEARTPLIISGMAHAHQPRYQLADQLARHLVEKQKEWDAADAKVQSCLVEIAGLEGDIRNARDKSVVPEMRSRLEAARKRLPGLEGERDRYTQFYEVELDKKRAALTHDGVAEAQRKAGVGSFYVGDNVDLPHLLEQAIRAHVVYQRDRDYVVAPEKPGGEPGVIIVDQNTGRKMIGRQWSDGLHQAVEAKEGVRIKEETQTMATITIQNFFKQYEKLAGMTGTADTEATEFHEIYKLDVICIPTNVPVVREDRNDLVFLAEKDKWDAIVDEIKMFHDVGRPVLVGTTSVEKSEMLSQMLSKRHQIEHAVLNAKQHEREADIIQEAGRLGAVMIATNMAGRGTDIKLAKISPEQLIDHWKRRALCPRHVTSDMPEDEIVRACYRHIAPRELELRKDKVEAMSDADIRRRLLEKWTIARTYTHDKKAASMSEAELLEALDASGTFLLHRLGMFRTTEELGGLHVVGTERHESRRIDNQLRGRSGRQGDKGSSRFFLSLEDDLMKMFAGERTLGLLSKLGMKEGDAIENPMLNRAVERAQRKVEERNFLHRKNILEYDEIMDVQRNSFYGTRQDILEGRGVKELIFEQIDDSVNDAAALYLDRNYPGTCIADWVRDELGVGIDPDRVRSKDREDLHLSIRRNAKEENFNTIRITIPEFMPDEMPREEWDYQGLVDWAKSRFKLDLRLSDVRDMTRDEVVDRLEAAGEKMIEAADLSPLDTFLVPHYGEQKFAEWSNNKFETDFKAEDFVGREDIETAVDHVMERARQAYRKREMTYPIDFALDMTTANMQRDPRQAFEQLARWAKVRYGLDWTADTIAESKPKEIRDQLLEAAEKWTDEEIVRRAREASSSAKTPDELEAWFKEHYGAILSEDDRELAEADLEQAAETKLRGVLRAELTQFERWILLQIFDQAWKDHLHAMDQVRDSISYRSFSQKDPRIEFKREGARLFTEMQSTVRDKVTDFVYKARLAPQPAPQQQQQQRQAQPSQQQQQGEERGGQGAQQPHQRPPMPAQAATAAAQAMARQQQADRTLADEAGSAPVATRKRQPRTVAQTVGRNEPCPCGSGKKFKQCCGKK